MSKKQASDSLPIWVILVILFIAVIAIYFFFKNESVNKYKNDLSQRIREKEDTIIFLKDELSRLKFKHDILKSGAIALFKIFKVIGVIIFLSIGAIFYVVFNMDYFNALLLIGGIITLTYQIITIVIQNKIGDFNRTLELIQDYLIQQKFKKADFNPIMIEVVEKRLINEQAELFEIKEQYLFLINGTNEGGEKC